MGGNKVRYIDWDTKKDEKLVTKIYIYQIMVMHWGQQICVKELRGSGKT